MKTNNPAQKISPDPRCHTWTRTRTTYLPPLLWICLSLAPLFNRAARAAGMLEQPEATICQPLQESSPNTTLDDISTGRIIAAGLVSLEPFLLPCEGTQDICTQLPTGRVQPDSIVGITKAAKGFTCVQYADKRQGPVAGWLPLAQVVSLLPSWKVDVPAWSGTWQIHDNVIRITDQSDAGLHFVGGAVHRTRMGPKVGYFNQTANPVLGKVALLSDHDECSLSIAMIGNMLAVFNPGGCGETNVSFTGLYIRE